MKKQGYILYAVLLFSLTLACGSGQSGRQGKTVEVDDEFKQYWMSGKAELTSYHLQQARYGEVHEGHAVLVFVTEDFSGNKQVKLDDPESNKEDAIKVMKLNMTKKFTTGIYPYSMMLSVFSPVRDKNQHALKVSTSSQEWCGHTFTQLNLEGKSYRGMVRSYFESEGDRSFELKEAYLEDEIWTWIRIRPEMLPVGEVKMIRGTFAARLRHLPVAVEKVNTTLVTEADERIYTVRYPSDERELSVRFKSSFPHEIISWKETYVSGWGASAKKLTTVATVNKRIQLDYWRKNHVNDSIYRQQLGL